MRKYFVVCSALALLLIGGTFVLGHPHFNKTVTVALPGGVEATITYNTVPTNEMHATKAAVGEFLTPRRPRLKLSAELKAGSITIPAGEYIIGALKNGENDYTMALYPGPMRSGEKPDPAKMIKLESMYSGSAGKAPHLLLDISPGSGKLEGRAVLTLHFGSMFLGGALT